MIAFAFVSGRRSTELEVDRAHLTVKVNGPFGNREHSWNANELRTVRVAPTGMRVNDVPVLCLEVEHGDGKTRLLSGRSTEELDWVADRLHEEVLQAAA